MQNGKSIKKNSSKDSLHILLMILKLIKKNVRYFLEARQLILHNYLLETRTIISIKKLCHIISRDTYSISHLEIFKVI